MRVTLLGHATVLINFFGFNIITDPALFSRVGIRLPGFTVGPKRLTAPALRVRDLPRIDLVLLSHAHFDHFDTRTLHALSRKADLITASRTSDIAQSTMFRSKRELRWGEEVEVRRDVGALRVRAFEVRHWGARLRTDNYRGYNGYVLERDGRRIIFGGDTAQTGSFATLRDLTLNSSAGQFAIQAVDGLLLADEIMEFGDGSWHGCPSSVRA